jgi:hypothetical protein
VVVDSVIALANKVSNCHTPIELVYLGTATYDAEAPRVRQTSAFVERGINVKSLEVANGMPSDVKISPSFFLFFISIYTSNCCCYGWCSLIALKKKNSFFQKIIKKIK